MMWEYEMGWGWLGMALFWLVPVFLILMAAKYLSSGNAGGDGVKSGRALEVLEGRYARGEIDRAEYLRKRDDLKSD